MNKNSKITVKQLRKLNPYIKTDEQARKIINTYHREPKITLDNVITEARRVYNEGRG